MIKVVANNRQVCFLCKKEIHIGFNKPHSQHRTKRKIFPNIQKINGVYLCTRCMRSGVKNELKFRK